MRKTKRGRLSSIDLLPEQADPLVSQALADLRERKKPQTAILEALNAGLADLGIAAISKSAFNRKSMWMMTNGRSIQEAREISAAMNETLSKVPDGDIGRLLNDVFKTMIFELISEKSLSPDGMSMRSLADGAKALKDLEQALNLNVGTTEKALRNFAHDATKAVDRVAKQTGLTTDTVDAIKRNILGITEGKTEGKQDG